MLSSLRGPLERSAGLSLDAGALDRDAGALDRGAGAFPREFDPSLPDAGLGDGRELFCGQLELPG
jgi:hypothetical protein